MFLWGRFESDEGLRVCPVEYLAGEADGSYSDSQNRNGA